MHSILQSPSSKCEKNRLPGCFASFSNVIFRFCIQFCFEQFNDTFTKRKQCSIHIAYYIMSNPLPSLSSFQAIFFFIKRALSILHWALGSQDWTLTEFTECKYCTYMLYRLGSNTVHIYCTGSDHILYIYIVPARIIYCTYMLYRLGSCNF